MIPTQRNWCYELSTGIQRWFLLALLIFSTQLATSQTITVDGDPSDWPAVLKRTDIPKTFRHDANNTNDDQWTGGSQDKDMVNTWYWIKGNTNDKGDITNAGAALIGTRIYFFGDRTAVQGNAQIGFWFFLGGIAPTGTGLVQSTFTGQNRDGDILAISNFTNGGGAAAPTIYRRQGNTLVEDATITAFVSTNKMKAMQYVPPGVTTADPTWPFAESWTFTPKSDGVTGEYPDPLFFEGYIDFGNARDANLCFTNFLLETRNSHSLDASLQDFVAGNFDVTPRPSLDLDPVCEGDDLVITANVVGGLAPLEYAWSVNNGPYSNFSTDNTLTLYDVPFSLDGKLVSVKVKGANGCISDAVSAELEVNDIPEITTSDADVCENGATGTAQVDLVSLVTNPGNGTLSFYLSEANAKAELNAISLNGDNEVSAPIGTTRYWVRSEATGNCYAVDFIDVKVTDNPDITTADATVCENAATGAALVNLVNLVTNPDGGALSFYTSQADAIAEQNAITLNNNNEVSAPVGGPTRYWVRSEATGNCYSVDYIDVTVTNNPDVTADNTTICEGESVNLTSLINGDGGTVTFHLSQAAADAGTGALDPTTVSPAKGVHEYFVRSTSAANTDCFGTAKFTVTVNACSKIELLKQTNGVVDPTKTWSFTISGGDLAQPVTESVSGDADGILFDGLTLSKAQTYTICETNVAAGFTVTIQYWDGDSWENVPVYDPNVINGGGDFGQGEAVGNYCFKIGAGGIALPGNTYGSTNVVALRLLINNIQPPGGNARTPGYWKNWNTCSNGNQAATAEKNGGKEAGFWLMTDHLPHTMWSTASSSFVIESCEEGVAVLDERQFVTNGKKLASDAAYKLAKHLFAYQLNKKSGSYACASTAQTAALAEALLAKYNFNATLSSYLSNKEKLAAKKADYNLALQYAKALDAYNNNLPCPATVIPITKLAMNGADNMETVTELKVSASPNPFNDKVRFEIESPVSGHGNLEVFNMLGQKVKTVYEGHVTAGRGQVFEFSVPQTLRSNLIYVMRVGNYRVTGKLVRAQR